MKHLRDYLIINLFKNKYKINTINDIDLDNTSFFKDLDIFLEKIKLNIVVSRWNWNLTDTSVIDCELETEDVVYRDEDYNDYYGNYYLTWDKSTGEFINMWFSGNDDEGESIHKEWT